MEDDAINQVLEIQGFFVDECRIQGDRAELFIMQEEPGFECPECGQLHLCCYDRRERRVQDLPMSEKKVFLTFFQHRVECDCGAGVVTERLDFVEPLQRQTKRFQETLYWYLKTGTTTSKAGRAFGLSWTQVRHIDARMIEKEQGRQSWKGLRRICVDEKSIGRGHQYITIVSDLERRRVVFVADGRKAASLNKFYRRIGKARAREIEVVAMDVWDPYIKSTKKYAPQADIVFDKFHILRQLNDKIDQYRRQQQSKLDRQGRLTLKGSRWILLKAGENLSEKQQQKLDCIAKNNEPLYKAYLLKEQFRDLLEPTDLVTAMDRLADWFSQVIDGDVEPLKRFVRQCGRWFQGLMNYFKYGLTNALSEAINRKISLMVRLAHGFRDHEYFKLKIYQQCRDFR